MAGHAIAVPATVSDPVNAAILAVAEDRLSGFQIDPFGEIAARTGIDVATVIERVVAMLEAGTVRRVRQTLLATNLAAGALCAWEVPPERLDAAFDFMFRDDPFSGHVVIRTTDTATAGSTYRLWTTLKVPQGFSLRKHAQWLATRVGAQRFRLMPAKMLFALGVGHVRRRGLEPGARANEPGRPIDAGIVRLSDLEWRVLVSLKREFRAEELARDLWRARASEAGVEFEAFVAIAKALQERGVIGRFSTFLEHVKPTAGNERVTRYNALFHWAVPPGCEVPAGCEVARHYVITHAYWREGGPEFHGVNVMAVAHGMEKDRVLAHKAAIDGHLREAGIDFSYTNVFWGGRSEIKPSEIAPDAYRKFCISQGIDPETMRADEEEGASA
ncbi:MAG: Lrp/AsnC family transcriptional regulator [Candidatus Eremiobacteraeota bacterium]|nr:Lrp/AsnC family transcriptional regulator [Candidatus Eremiobacteraeota bacterium]MBV8354166.1 Lrp/AsnC family transcriptional regulator [Candidatus Eremiobacteraeota bacterium]